MIFFTRLHHTLPECYADDTKLVCSLLQKSFIEVGLDLRQVEEWSKEWLLKINSDKSFILRFGKNNPLNSYSLNGITIPVSDTITDLGVIIDPSLGFSAHVNHVVNKASSALGWLLRTFSIRNAALTHLYKSYVLPLLEYNSAFWNPHLLKDIDALESVQRRFTKSFPFLRDLPYRARLEALQLESLEIRRLRATLILIYNIVQNHILHSSSASSFFQLSTGTLDVNSHCLRGHSLKLFIPRANSGTLQNCAPIRFLHLWNDLTEDVVSAPNVVIFKRLLLKQDLSSSVVGRALRSN